jgi:hypothetical protein
MLKEQIKNEIQVETTKVLKQLNTEYDTLNKEIKDSTGDKQITEKLSIKLNELIRKIEKTKESKIQDTVVDSFINTEIGTYKENSVVKMIEDKLKITLNTSQKFHSVFIMSTEKYDYYLGGKMDGICEGKYIVEIKNRMNKFFTSVKDYEKCQIQSYMLMTDYKLAKLVECFNNKLRITDIYRDDIYLKEIKDCLVIFINNIERADISKYYTLNEADQRSYINNLYLREIMEYHQKEDLDTDDTCLFE